MGDNLVKHEEREKKQNAKKEELNEIHQRKRAKANKEAEQLVDHTKKNRRK